MPKNYISICLLLLTVQLMYAQNHKRALLIALEKYGPDWSPIHCTNDVIILKSALLSRGFLEENITIIDDKQGKKRQLLLAFEEFIKDSKPNDVIFFHYSGHGQSVQDNNNDEVDHYDESIVPIDAPSEFGRGGYKGELHILDDELGVFFKKLRNQIGRQGDIFISLDACFSGTGTRLLGYNRGTTEVMASSEFKNTHPIDSIKKEESIIDEQIDSMITIFSATKAYELNGEIIGQDNLLYGPLSYSLANALISLEPNASYDELFHRITISMGSSSKYQTPSNEGYGKRIVFNGLLEAITPYFFAFDYIPSLKTLVLNFGSLHGFFPGSKVSLFNPGTTDFSIVPMATGEVISSTPITSKIMVNKPLNKTEAIRKKIVISAVSFGDLNVSVKLDLPGKQGLQNSLRNFLIKYPSIKLVNEHSAQLTLESNNDFLRRQNRLEDYIQITDTRGGIIDSFLNTSESNIEESIARSLMNFLFAEYVKKIDKKSTTFRSDYELKIGNCKEESDIIQFIELPTQQYVVQKDYFRADTGTCFKLKITKTGLKPFCVAVLLVDALNHLEVLVPENFIQNNDYCLDERSESFYIPEYKLQLPLGKDVYKIIISKNSIDFRSLFRISYKGSGFDNEFKMLSELFGFSSSSFKSPPASEIDIKTFVIEVNNKQNE